MTDNKTLATYKWTKEGKLGNYEQVELYSHGTDVHMYGFNSVPTTVAKAVRFMFSVSAKKLTVDEYRIELVLE